MGFQFNPFTGALDSVNPSGLQEITGNEVPVNSIDPFQGIYEVCSRVQLADGSYAWGQLNSIAWEGYTPPTPPNQSLDSTSVVQFAEIGIVDPNNTSVTLFEVRDEYYDDDSDITYPSHVTINTKASITDTLSVTGASTFNSTLSVSGAATLNSTLSVSGTATITGATTINSALKCNSLAITSPTIPTASTSTGVKGQICYDSSYLYVCIATNTWKRTALSSW